MTASSIKNWYVQGAREVHGPYSKAQLVRLYDTGKLKPMNKISKNCERWMIAAQLLGEPRGGSSSKGCPRVESSSRAKIGSSVRHSRSDEKSSAALVSSLTALGIAVITLIAALAYVNLKKTPAPTAVPAANPPAAPHLVVLPPAPSAPAAAPIAPAAQGEALPATGTATVVSEKSKLQTTGVPEQSAQPIASNPKISAPTAADKAPATNSPNSPAMSDAASGKALNAATPPERQLPVAAPAVIPAVAPARWEALNALDRSKPVLTWSNPVGEKTEGVLKHFSAASIVKLLAERDGKNLVIHRKIEAAGVPAKSLKVLYFFIGNDECQWHASVDTTKKSGWVTLVANVKTKNGSQDFLYNYDFTISIQTDDGGGDTITINLNNLVRKKFEYRDGETGESVKYAIPRPANMHVFARNDEESFISSEIDCLPGNYPGKGYLDAAKFFKTASNVETVVID